MKYKQVFFIWLLADAFLAAGLVCFGIYELLTGGGPSDDVGIFLLAAAIGIGCSLPSLFVMLLFHLAYTKNAKHPAEYTMPYVALIVCINMLYLLIGQYWFGMTAEFNVFYVGSTLAGLLSFYLVDRKIKKKAANIAEQNDTV
jgi:hypothetical protein